MSRDAGGDANVVRESSRGERLVIALFTLSVLKPGVARRERTRGLQPQTSPEAPHGVIRLRPVVAGEEAIVAAFAVKSAAELADVVGRLQPA